MTTRREWLWMMWRHHIDVSMEMALMRASIKRPTLRWKCVKATLALLLNRWHDGSCIPDYDDSDELAWTRPLAHHDSNWGTVRQWTALVLLPGLRVAEVADQSI